MATISRSSTYKSPARASQNSFVKKEKIVTGKSLPLPPPLPLKGRGGEGDQPSGGTDELMGMVASLTKDKQKEVLARMSLLVNGGSADDQRDQNMWSGSVHTALVQANGGSPVGVPGVMLIHKHVSLATAWAGVSDFMQASRLDQLTASERQSVYQMLATILVAHTKKLAAYVNAPMTPRFIGGQCPNLTAVFEQSFPGYIASGLAHVVARSFSSGVRHDQDQDD